MREADGGKEGERKGEETEVEGRREREGDGKNTERQMEARKEKEREKK